MLVHQPLKFSSETFALDDDNASGFLTFNDGFRRKKLRYQLYDGKLSLNKFFLGNFSIIDFAANRMSRGVRGCPLTLHFMAQSAIELSSSFDNVDVGPNRSLLVMLPLTFSKRVDFGTLNFFCAPRNDNEPFLIPSIALARSSAVYLLLLTCAQKNPSTYFLINISPYVFTNRFNYRSWLSWIHFPYLLHFWFKARIITNENRRENQISKRLFTINLLI